MALEELLEYQRVDGELRTIEQTVAGSEERKKMLQAKTVMKNAESTIAAHDKRAVELKKLRDELIARVDETSHAIAEFADVDEIVDGGGDVSFYKKNAQKLLEKLRAAKSDLARLLSEIEALSEEYRKMMERGKQMNRQYKEYSEKFREIQAQYAPKVTELTAQLEEIAKKIDPRVLERYKAKRKERIYPVLVPLTNGMCVCGMDLSLAQQGKLAGGNIIECEHCHRFIYKKA